MFSKIPEYGACSWAQSEGQDFIANHQTSSIDYATFHSWADNWFDADLSFQQAWIQQHAADAASIGKPVRAFQQCYRFNAATAEA